MRIPGRGRGGTVSFTGRRGKGRTSSRKKILICRSPGSAEPEPGTTLHVTATHPHRGSCPASPGEPGPGRDGRGRGWLSAGSAARPGSSPDAPAGRAQPEQRHAGRASLAGRGRSRRRGRGLRPAGPLHRRCSREGHAARHAPPRRCSPAPVRSRASPEPKGRRRGEDPLDDDRLDPARPGPRRRWSQQQAVPWHPSISTGTSPRGDPAPSRPGHASARRSDILTYLGATAGPALSSRLRPDRRFRYSWDRPPRAGGATLGDRSTQRCSVRSILRVSEPEATDARAGQFIVCAAYGEVMHQFQAFGRAAPR